MEKSRPCSCNVLWLSRTCGGKPHITHSFLENVVLKALICKVLLIDKLGLSF